MLSADMALCVMALWLFAVGGVIGSFLNVVVYRLPAGMSLIRPGSHCPVCQKPIRWFDNVPIFGWLCLRGRCRDCGTAISPRYPLVETLTAVLFLTVGVAEFLSGGVHAPSFWDGSCTELRTDWNVGELAATYAFHLMLLCTLLAATLIAYDKKLVTAQLFVPALLVGCVGAGLPAILSLLGRPASGHVELRNSLLTCLDAVAGTLAGTFLGWVLSRFKRQTGVIFALACVGLFLGPLAVAIVSGVTAVLLLLQAGLSYGLPSLRRIPPMAWVALGAFGWILFWARLVNCVECVSLSTIS